MRIKGKLGSGKELEQTILLLPGAYPQSGGTLPLSIDSDNSTAGDPAISARSCAPPNIFGGESVAFYAER